MVNEQNQAWSGSGSPVWLSQLIKGLVSVSGWQDRLVAGLQLSSARVSKGDVFLALPGITADGRNYIDQAIENGAVAVLFEKDGGKYSERLADEVPVIGISNLKPHIGTIASRYFNHPSRSLDVVGITGTNGKTTTAYLLTQALNACGLKSGYSGTIGTGFIDSLEKSDLTTVDAVSMQRQLAGFVQDQARSMVLEVSSHGLHQGRVNGIEFNTAVFTNLTQDHLDYHQSMENYAAAKQKLFEFDSLRNAVVNTDDLFGRKLANLCRERGLRCLTYGCNDADFRPENIRLDIEGISFDMEFEGQRENFKSTLLGEVNVLNLLATIAVLTSFGIKLDRVAEVVPGLSAPPGRMEVFRNLPSQPSVVVDFAHTPDALERALGSLKKLCQGKLVVVFGCGGDRDQGKRPKMGCIAERTADRVIVTDDNPRTEPADEIVRQIIAGMNSPATVMHDRRAAVKAAISDCTGDDIVLVAGKGHEETQSIGGQQFVLSDRVIVPELLEELS